MLYMYYLNKSGRDIGKIANLPYIPQVYLLNNLGRAVGRIANPPYSPQVIEKI